MAKKPKLRKLGVLIKELQEKWFNPFIRERDRKGEYFRCISCGEVKEYRSMQAGHFHSRGKSSGLRFDEENVHGECDGCNCFNDDHLINYTLNLQIKIGMDAFNALQARYDYYHINKKQWKRYEIMELIEVYKKKLHDARLEENELF